MLHLLYGPDDYSSTQALSALLSRAGEASGGYVTRLDGAGNSWQALQEACMAMSLFATSQVVVVRQLLGAWSGRGEGSAKSGGRPSPADFAAFVRGMPASTLLILHEGDLSATNRYLKELLTLPPDVCAPRAFSLPGDAARQAWIVERVRAAGRTIEPGASAELARRCTGDLWQLAGEIEKLLLYRWPDGAIRRADVELLVAADEELSAFKLIDAVAGKDARTVVDLVDKLLDSGEAPEQILALLGSRIRDLLLAQAAQAEGIPAATIQQRLGWSAGRYGHVQRASRDFDRPDLGQAQQLLLAADLALKSRPGHERPLILLLTLLAIAQRRGMPELERSLAL